VLELAPHKLARVEDLHFTARDGHPLPARLYAPEHPALDRPALPVLLYLHGGGFTVGSIATHDVLCRHLSHLAHCAVVSVDYRLAPQHQFPTAAFDAWDSLNALRSASRRPWGWMAARLAIGGDSAGGTLAAVTALMARDAGLPLALQLLFYPGCAGHQNMPSHHAFAHGFMLEVAHIDYFYGHYLRCPCRPQRLALCPAGRRWTNPAMCATWRAWPRRGSAWPNVTPWPMKASPTPTGCAAPMCRWTWRSTAAWCTASSTWGVPSPKP
jgi:acetyl esterase